MRKKQTWIQWARAVAKDRQSPSRIELSMIAALTGQDQRALAAVAACWELYACSDNAGRRGAIVAVFALLPAMQSNARFIARELIPFALDWSYRDTVWAQIEKLEAHAPIRAPDSSVS